MKDQYITSDLTHASILLTLDYPLLKHERIDHKRVVFYFDNPSGNAQNVVNKYVNGDLSLNLRAFIDNQTHLKGLIFNTMKENKYE